VATGGFAADDEIDVALQPRDGDRRHFRRREIDVQWRCSRAMGLRWCRREYRFNWTLVLISCVTYICES
jgi:hypothetical protein